MCGSISSVAQSYPTPCDPMNRNMPGLPVHHKLLEFTQTHAHQVGDAIQPSHPLSSPSSPAPNTPSIRVFSNEATLHISWPKYWSFSFSMSFQWAPRTYWTPRTYLLLDRLVGSPCSPRDSEGSSPTPQFKSINSSALSFLYSPTLTSLHDYWKNHSFD